MTTKMQHRRGTASQWSSANPVLAAGELGVVTDTARVKCGNGSSAWNDLPFLTLADGEVTTAKIADDAVTTGKIAAGAVGTTDLADGAVTDAKVSDVTLAKVTGAGTAAGLNVPASGDATSGQVVKGSDSRLTDTRTPKAHKASHATGQADALAPSDIGAATSAQGAKADTAVQPTLINAKGDLLVGAAADNLMSLPAAADGRMLTTDGSQAAGMRWATPTTRVGSGSPLGIVVPDFVGQEFVDTQQTLGARKWVATGTTASSWVVNDGDTGWLPVTTWTAAGVVSGTALPSGWQPFPDYAGGFWLRRRQEGVTAHITNLQAASINPAFLVLPTGWRASKSNNFALPMIPGTGEPEVRTWQVASGSLGRGSNATISASDFVAYSVLPLWPTSDPWPTAAPV